MTKKPTYEELEQRVGKLEEVLLGHEHVGKELLLKENIITSSSSVIATCDLEGKMTYGNPSFLKTWGFDDAKEFLGRHFSEFWVVKKILDEIMQVLRSKEEWFGEIKARRKDGTIFDVQVSAATVFDSEGNPIALTSTSIDITERKRTEEELRESEGKFTKAFMAGPNNIIITRMKDGKIIDVNKHFLSDTGFTKNEIIGKTTSELGIWAFADDRKLFVKMLQDKGEVDELEAYFRLKDGTIAPYMISSRPINLKRIKCVISITRNIADLKQTEEALRESEERFRNVYDTAPLAFVVWDKDARVTDWNKKAEEVFGWTKEEVVGYNFFDFLIPKKDRPQVEDVVNSLLKDDLMSHSINENLTKVGKIITCEWNNSALHDDDGNIIGAISLGLDITERKRVEKEREKFIKELQEALTEIKMLRGILPLCSFCKKIRDDKGYWEQVDVYIDKHSQADISHSVCPECAKENYPDLDIYDD